MKGRSGVAALIALVAVLVGGLPVAAWLDVRHLSETTLLRQAGDFNSVISGIRDFYASDVVGRVLGASGKAVVTARYRKVHGGIPIPATFSLALGNVVDAHQGNIAYRFISDYPFRGRPPHVLDAFERRSLAGLRAHEATEYRDVSWHGLRNRVRFVAPVIMTAACVQCHNTSPDSPKRDWKVGDVRGIQELSIEQPVATNVLSFKWLLLYFMFAGALGFGFIVMQRRQALAIANVNERLASTNAFLSHVSSAVSRYLSPQIYRSIFSGRTPATIHATRKKLTIFFSDIVDFTSTTGRMQPEELTSLLNEYFTEMSAIALAHGGTVDKFVGDAMLVFFGDPETRGAAEDARACVRMACAMQERLVRLQDLWRERGVEQPFLVRMGINTGYCDVGNFGSSDRMDYTIIGAEVNLAARLQSTAKPGTIVLSYETYALVREIVTGHTAEPIRAKGIEREILPYVIESVLPQTSSANGHSDGVFRAKDDGVEVSFDPRRIDDAAAARLRRVLQEALDALDAARRPHPPA